VVLDQAGAAAQDFSTGSQVSRCLISFGLSEVGGNRGKRKESSARASKRCPHNSTLQDMEVVDKQSAPPIVVRARGEGEKLSRAQSRGQCTDGRVLGKVALQGENAVRAGRAGFGW